MSDPADIALLTETVLRLSNTASVAELLVNCQREEIPQPAAVTGCRAG